MRIMTLNAHKKFRLNFTSMKEKASNNSKKKKETADVVQVGGGGRKPTVNRKPSQQKKTHQDDKQEYADLRAAIDGGYCPEFQGHYLGEGCGVLCQPLSIVLCYRSSPFKLFKLNVCSLFFFKLRS